LQYIIFTSTAMHLFMTIIIASRVQHVP